MKKYEIVKKNQEFNDIINNGKYFKNEYYVIYYLPNNLNFPKFGIAVSTKYGNAVERNKVKRQLRMIIDNSKELFNDYNYIIMIKKNIKGISYQEMNESLKDLLMKGKRNEKKV